VMAIVFYYLWRKHVFNIKINAMLVSDCNVQ